MLSLRQNPHAAPNRWQYRLSRFMLSRVYWVIKTFVIPILFVCFVAYQLWTSQGLRDYLYDTKNAIYQKVAYLPMFVVSDVTIKNATALREEEIRGLLDFKTPKSILEIDRDGLRERLNQVNAVGRSEIRYNYSGTMEIILEPRIPALIYFDGKEFETVDANGHRVEALLNRNIRPELAVISGEGAKDAAPEAEKIVKYLAPFASQVRGLLRVGDRRWDIILTNGGKIMLPSQDPVLALAVVLKEQKLNDVLNRDIESFDIRNPNRPIIGMKHPPQEEVDQSKKDAEGQKP